MHCGDFLTSPFSPDPPGETIDLLRSENVQVIYGNNEVYFRDWGTPRWEATVAERGRRPDSPDYFLQHIARGQAELTPADLAWLRALPAELSLDGARQGDVYVCHGMPGNPFSTIWATNPAFTPDFTAEEIDSALSRKGVASADLILCGHTPGPTLLRIALPNDQAALVVRSSGHLPGDGPGPWHQGICVLTHRGGSPASPAGASSSNGRPSSRVTRTGPKPALLRLGRPESSGPEDPRLGQALATTDLVRTSRRNSDPSGASVDASLGQWPGCTADRFPTDPTSMCRE